MYGNNKKKRLSRYLKDFKHHQTQCSFCDKTLERATLVCNGRLINKVEIAQYQQLISEEDWQQMRSQWMVVCRFCGELHYKRPPEPYFDITGFLQYLLKYSNNSITSIREYVVRIRRLSQKMVHKGITDLDYQQIISLLPQWFPKTDLNNYLTVIRKYHGYHEHHKSLDQKHPDRSSAC